MIQSARSSFVSVCKAACALALLAGAPASAESIRGFVEFHGEHRAAEKLRRDSDKFCARTPAFDISMRVNGNRLRDVWVHVVKGAPDQPGSADRTVTLKQSDCMYEPHVAAIQAGNRVTVENTDPVLHNVHAYAGSATLFNRAMPGVGTISYDHATTSKWTDTVRWKCDVHAWMSAFVGVSRNPYYAVTDEEGGFVIDNIPPGNYSLAAWHEKLGSKTLEITVEPGKQSEAIFRFGQKITEADRR